MTPLLLIIVTAVVMGAVGVWWYLAAQARQRIIDEKAATLFKPMAGGGNGMMMGAAAMPRAGAVVDGDALDDDVDALEGDDEDLNTNTAEGDTEEAAKARLMSRLQRKKQEKLREKEERRRAVAAAVEQRRIAQEAAAQSDQASLEAQQKLAEEETAALELLRNEKKQRDDAEFRLWAGHIGVDSKGELGAVDEVQQRLIAFLTSSDTQTRQKVLVLEDVAREHQVTVEVLVSTLENLMKKDDTITGVFDDRGKFIFVTEGELIEMAKFLRGRGRVSMSELIREANRIVAAPATGEEGC